MSETTVALSRSADQKHCFSCGQLVHVTTTACPKCGASQNAAVSAIQPVITQTDSMANKAFCRGCGQAIHAAAPTCPKCGAPQKTLTATHSSKSKTTAALLAFFLGAIGAHRFYLGHIGWGVIYLIFFWTAIPAIAALIEGIVYLSMSEEEFARKYP